MPSGRPSGRTGNTAIGWAELTPKQKYLLCRMETESILHTLGEGEMRTIRSLRTKGYLKSRGRAAGSVDRICPWILTDKAIDQMYVAYIN